MRQGLIRHLWLALVIIAFCAPLFAGLGRTDMENDEAIYSYAVDSILATGDWLNPHLSPDDDTFLEKPPLKFWIVAAPIAVGLLPHDELGMRVWDALFGAVAFVYVFLLGRRLAGPICGVIAVFVLAVYSPLLFSHGLRVNNMEAPLVLCYCGGIYHYLRWASPDPPSARYGDALAVTLCFFLGFMTKFVASFFLPIVLVAATLAHRATLRRLLANWRVWALMALVFVCLASPWFIYQHSREGSGFWRVLVAEHVYARFTKGLDPEHLQPWNFYYAVIFKELQHSGTAALTIVGGILLVVRTARAPSLDKLLVLGWFAIPLGLMSLGSSKLHHYAYPFLPPIALAAGFAPGWLIQSTRERLEAAMEAVQSKLTVVRSRFGPRIPAFLKRMAGLAPAGSMPSTPRGPENDAPGSRAVLDRVLLGLAGLATAIAVATVFLGVLEIHVGGVRVFRNSHVARPLVIAFLLSTFAGRGVPAIRVLLPCALLAAVLPMNQYENMWTTALRYEHPMRTARDCLVRAQARASRGEGAGSGVYAIGEHRWFLHSYYYYFRKLGRWERSPKLNARKTADSLFEPGRQRPVLIGYEDYSQLKEIHGDAVRTVPVITLPTALMLTPGPYAVCSPQLSPLTLQ